MSAKYWNVEDNGNVNQDNNAVEQICGRIQDKVIYRETCGTSALESCLDAMGIDQSQCGMLQPSDYYALIMNDQRYINNRAWSKPMNRYPEAYPLLLKLLYPKIKCNIVYIDKKTIEEKIDTLKKELTKPNSTVIALLKDPSHFVGVHHTENDIVYYNDSWLANYFNKSNKHKRSIAIRDFILNCKYCFIVISE